MSDSLRTIVFSTKFEKIYPIGFRYSGEDLCLNCHIDYSHLSCRIEYNNRQAAGQRL